MNVTLLSLSLHNFKGQRDFTLGTFGGQNVDVYGDNASGKTTLADAWFWLLFGKDSQNRASFEIKTLDASGQAIPRLDHEVEAEIFVDGKRLTLRKVLKEKWVTQRGKADAVNSGHTTDYSIDGVPAKESEYAARVAQIASEETFRILTDPYYFAETLHWQKRRKLLLEVCGDVSDAEVVESEPRLASLPGILGERTVDDHMKVLRARRTETVKELDVLPARIDEASRSVLDGDDADWTSAIEGLRSRRAELVSKKMTLQAGGAVASLNAELDEVKRRLTAETQTLDAEARREAAGLREEARLKRSQAADDIAKAESQEREVDLLNSSIMASEAEIAMLRARYESESSKSFVPGSPECPACGQAIPTEKIAAAEAAFNAAKSESLESIQTRGKEHRARVSGFQAKLDELLVSSVSLRTLAQEAAKESAELDARASDIEARAQNEASTSRSALELRTQVADLIRRIEEAREGPAAEVALLDSEISALDTRAKEAEAAQAAVLASQRARHRVDELRAKERELARALESTDKEVFLCEAFVRAKVRLLEDRINVRFASARFRLFKELVNGGLEECCDVSLDGVPYGSLNHGSRVNVGLDVIDTIAGHVGVFPPIFIDNAESVTTLRPTTGQQVRLIVSANDKALRAEAAGAAKATA